MPATLKPNRRQRAVLLRVTQFRRWLGNQRLVDFRWERALELAVELERELKRCESRAEKL